MRSVTAYLTLTKTATISLSLTTGIVCLRTLASTWIGALHRIVWLASGMLGLGLLLRKWYSPTWLWLFATNKYDESSSEMLQ